MSPGTSRPLRIIDATLREGCQAPGVRFSAGQSVEIARGLAALGIDQIECGHPSASAEEMERVRRVAALGLPCPILAHARARLEDIDAVAEAGCAWVGIFLGINGMTRRVRVPRLSVPQILERIRVCIQHAHGLGLRVRYSLEDASRTEEELALRAFGAAVDAGVDRICFADTVGMLEPAAVAAWVHRLGERFPETALEVHLHDDRGLALANALAALDAGAGWISTSVHGLGERSGITDLCTLLANLHYRGEREIPAGGDLRRLSTLVKAYSRSPADARRPVVGRAAFTHTAPLHVKAVCRDEKAYTWLPPEMVGAETSVACDGLPSHPAKLIPEPMAIPATELEYHRKGPGVRWVMIDERLVTDCRQYCIAREVPSLGEPPDGHVDVHVHHVDSLFLFLGHEPGLRGLRAEVRLGDHVEVVDSPKAVFIPAGVPHTFRLLAGSGIFVNHVLSGTYNESLLTHD
jgi:2-isopropylmalate synthase